MLDILYQDNQIDKISESETRDQVDRINNELNKDQRNSETRKKTSKYK